MDLLNSGYVIGLWIVFFILFECFFIFFYVIFLGLLDYYMWYNICLYYFMFFYGKKECDKNILIFNFFLLKKFFNINDMVLRIINIFITTFNYLLINFINRK